MRECKNFTYTTTENQNEVTEERTLCKRVVQSINNMNAIS